MDGPKNVMQLRLPGRKAHFLSGFFVIEVGAHHIYDDTGFCHNYHHRSVICMIEKNCSAQNVTDMSFFCSDTNRDCCVFKQAGKLNVEKEKRDHKVRTRTKSSGSRTLGAEEISPSSQNGEHDIRYTHPQKGA